MTEIAGHIESAAYTVPVAVSTATPHGAPTPVTILADSESGAPYWDDPDATEGTVTTGPVPAANDGVAGAASATAPTAAARAARSTVRAAGAAGRRWLVVRRMQIALMLI